MTLTHPALRLGAAVAATLAVGACGQSQNAAPANASPANTAAAAPAAGGDAGDVKTFLDNLYAHYKVGPSTSTWQPMDKNAPEVFDASMVQLMADDTKVLKGEVGVIDGDYLCGCQDYEPFTATVAVQSATPTTAKATADFRVFKTDQPHHLEYDLVKENGGWRIHDVRENDQSEQPPGDSLRVALEKEVKNPPKAGSGGDAD